MNRADKVQVKAGRLQLLRTTGARKPWLSYMDRVTLVAMKVVGDTFTRMDGSDGFRQKSWNDE